MDWGKNRQNYRLLGYFIFTEVSFGSSNYDFRAGQPKESFLVFSDGFMLSLKAYWVYCDNPIKTLLQLVKVRQTVRL